MQSDWLACPHCGTRTADMPDPQQAKQYSLGNLFKWGAGLFLVAWMLSLCTGKVSNPGASATATQRAFTDMDALSMCQQAFKRAAKDPEKASIPYVPNQGDAREFYFAWGVSTKMMRMRNGLGLEVAVSGSCFVDPVLHTITGMTMNGQTIK